MFNNNISINEIFKTFLYKFNFNHQNENFTPFIQEEPASIYAIGHNYLGSNPVTILKPEQSEMNYDSIIETGSFSSLDAANEELVMENQFSSPIPILIPKKHGNGSADSGVSGLHYGYHIKNYLSFNYGFTSAVNSSIASSNNLSNISPKFKCGLPGTS